MNESRFDHMTRLFATATSRRKVMSAVLAGVAATWLGEESLDRVNAKDKGKPKEKGNDKPKPAKPDKGKEGKGKGGESENVSVCHNGHTIEVGQSAVQSHLDHGDSLGPCAEESEEQPEPSVARVPSYHVSVECSYSAEQDRTTCTCTAAAGDQGTEATIRSLLVPGAEVCSDVVGGDFTEIATPTEGQQTGYRSNDDRPQVTLVFSGRVTVGGTASYWCSTTMGLVPAPGPGFVCVEPRAQTAATATPESEISDSTGAIIIEAHSCGEIVSTPTTSSSWYDQCVTPDSQLTLKLTAGSATPVAGGLTTATDVSGRAQFTQLPPGSYTLDAVGANWCHAESDNVDSEGNLLVRAGTYCHVWIFFCKPLRGS
jgi:hypothetical protein